MILLIIVVKLFLNMSNFEGVYYKGIIDCSANPNYPISKENDCYRVLSEIGKIGGIDGISVLRGEAIVCIKDNKGGTQEEVGDCFRLYANGLEDYDSHSYIKFCAANKYNERPNIVWFFIILFIGIFVFATLLSLVKN